MVDLLHWRDLKQSGLVFGSVLLLLFSLTQFSVVSVIAYLALAVLSATISFRVYKSVLQAVQKTDEGHPFKLVKHSVCCLHLCVLSNEPVHPFSWLLSFSGTIWKWKSLSLQIRSVSMWIRLSCTSTPPWRSSAGCFWFRIWSTPLRWKQLLIFHLGIYHSQIFDDTIAISICVKGALTNFALLVDTTEVIILTPISMDEVFTTKCPIIFKLAFNWWSQTWASPTHFRMKRLF